MSDPNVSFTHSELASFEEYKMQMVLKLWNHHWGDMAFDGTLKPILKTLVPCLCCRFQIMARHPNIWFTYKECKIHIRLHIGNQLAQ